MGRRSGFIFLAVMVMVMVWWAATAEEIVVGYTGPLSGPAAEYGQDCVNGIDMAIREINAAGGVVVDGRKHTFRLEKKDDGIKPDVAIDNARKLRQEHKAIAVFNPVANTIAALMKINQEKKNEFLVMGYTSVPQIAETGNRLLITMTMPFTIYARVYVDLAWEKGWRKVAMLVTSGPYGDAWRKVFGDAWVKRGGTITLDKPVNYYTRTDFAAPLAEALATEPDFLLIGGPSGTTAMIIEQSRARGYEGGFVMIDQSKLDAIYQVMQKPLGLEGAIGVAMVTHIPYPATAAFTQNYTGSYKRNVTWESVLHYTNMHALARAVAAAGTASDVRAIRQALPRVFPLLGDQFPMEAYGLQPNGRVIAMAVIQTMKHGRFTQPNTYVWWAKTQKEFDAVKKMTKGATPMVWKRID